MNGRTVGRLVDLEPHYSTLKYGELLTVRFELLLSFANEYSAAP